MQTGLIPNQLRGVVLLCVASAVWVGMANAQVSPTVAVFRGVTTAGGIRAIPYGSTTAYMGGGGFVGDASAAQGEDGQTFVVGVDNVKGVWVNTFDREQLRWGEWIYIGGIAEGTPVIAIPPGGQPRIFVRNQWQGYSMATYDPTTRKATWVTLGGVFGSDPSAAVRGDGSIFLAGRDTFGGVWTARIPPEGVTEPVKATFCGGIIQGKPGIAVGTDGYAYIVVRDPFGGAWMAWADGPTCGDWQPGGALIASDLEIVAARGTLYVVGLDQWGGVYYKAAAEGALRDRWPPGVWPKLGTLTDISLASLDAQAYLVGRVPAGDIYWYNFTTATWFAAGNASIAKTPPKAASKVGRATILSVSPPTIPRGANTTLTITGRFTNFTQGTRLDLGPDVTVGAIAVSSPTALTVSVTVSAGATLGSRVVTVASFGERVTYPIEIVGPLPPGSGSISSLVGTPTSVPYGVDTAVTFTAAVTGTPDPGGVSLQRLDPGGIVVAVVATMRNDGLGGDAVAGDGLFTYRSTLREFATGSIRFRAAATFGGSANYVFSPIATVTVTGTPPPSLTITTPSSLSYLNISPTTVSGTVTGSASSVVINSISTTVVNGTFTASVPLAEGPNILTATATSPGGQSGSASITVTLDTTPPHVTITSPVQQFVTTAASMSVTGNVNDIVVGTVNDQQARVTVNNVAAQVANRTFLAANIPLTMGANTIRAQAVDRSGNSATTEITVTRQAVQPGQIQLTSGNNQTGSIGAVLATPLAVSLTEPGGGPAANKPVIFSVTQNNGLLSIGNGTPAQSVVVNTNAQGQASANWKLGMRSGAGSDAVQAYSVSYEGTAVFTATANQGTPGKIVIDTGNNQTGTVNQPLPKPLIAVVIDAGNNRLANVPVTFTVQQGGGSFGGQPSVTVNTDSDGRVAATLTLGFQEGNSNNLVTATFPSNTGFPANFNASGRGPGDPARTAISGLVLDNSNQPIPGVSVRAALTNIVNSSLSSVQSAPAVQTDARGQFQINSAPIGFVKLLVDGATATLPGTFPTLDYDMVTVAGQVNTVGQTIYLLPIQTNNQICVTPTTGGGTLTVPEAPGFSLTFGPGQVTFPGGSKTGCVSVTVVHPDKVPMLPGFGQQPRFVVTIQPAGALFSPPAPITLPNVDGLAPREVTEMYSFDHDIGSFVAIGTGTVSDDGLVIRSNPGVGVLKAGWHCGGNPTTAGAAATCGPCAFCDGQNCKANPVQGNTCVNACLVGGSGTCTNGRCAGQFQPPGFDCGTGGKCDGQGNCGFPCVGPNCAGCPTCNSGNPCISDSCVNGQCIAEPNNFCRDACGGRTSGTCAVGNLTGTCDASGNCDLCSSIGTGATCTCGGGRSGVCNSNRQCDCQPPPSVTFFPTSFEISRGERISLVARVSPAAAAASIAIASTDPRLRLTVSQPIVLQSSQNGRAANTDSADVNITVENLASRQSPGAGPDNVAIKASHSSTVLGQVGAFLTKTVPDAIGEFADRAGSGLDNMVNDAISKSPDYCTDGVVSESASLMKTALGEAGAPSDANLNTMKDGMSQAVKPYCRAIVQNVLSFFGEIPSNYIPADQQNKKVPESSFVKGVSYESKVGVQFKGIYVGGTGPNPGSFALVVKPKLFEDPYAPNYFEPENVTLNRRIVFTPTTNLQLTFDLGYEFSVRGSSLETALAGYDGKWKAAFELKLLIF